jgi:hypothetical protein
MMGASGFAASSAQLAMRLLAAAMLFERTGKVFGEPTVIAAEFRRVFAGEVEPELMMYLEEGASYHLDDGNGPGSVDYLPPPTVDRARTEVNRAEEFLGAVVARLGLAPK